MKRFKNLSLKSKISWILVCVFIAIWVIITVYPFIFMVLNSFKGQFEILANGVFSLPQSFNLDNFKEVFNNGILHYFFNSILVCAVSLVITLLVAALPAFRSRDNTVFHSAVFSSFLPFDSSPFLFVPIVKKSHFLCQ